MRKFLLLLLGLLSVFTVFARNTDEAFKVLQRVSRQTIIPISLELKKDGSNMYYEYSVVNGVLRLKGSDNVALCRGFYDYVKAHKLGMYSWSGNNIQLPSSLPATNDVKVVSPFQNHYYFNVCTYGYSMPYWDWTRWEQEIDWMALHGINMPLALVGYEAILARVWKKMGLTDEEINGYFVGPAHLPWMRMGNVSGIDGPLNADWHKDQLSLQHKILNRMRSLGMKPICPGFPGFIPEAFKRIYPNLNIVETHWGGAFHNWMISRNYSAIALHLNPRLKYTAKRPIKRQNKVSIFLAYVRYFLYLYTYERASYGHIKSTARHDSRDKVDA